MISAGERVHRKSLQSLQEFRERLERLSHTPEIETSSEAEAFNAEETKTTHTGMGDKKVEKVLEATPVTTGVVAKTEQEGFERPDYSPTLDKVQERTRESSYETPTFLDIVLGRDRGKKKVHNVAASPVAAAPSPATVRRISSTEPLVYPGKGAEKPVMAPVMVKDGAGTELAAAIKDSSAEELREGLHRASVAFEGQEMEKEELLKQLEDQQEKEAVFEEYMRGTGLMAQRGEQYDTLCEQLVPGEVAGPIKLGTFITELIDVDNARIQEAEERATALQGKLEELAELTKKSLEAASARNAQLFEQNKLMAEQLAVKESQIVRLTALVEKAATTLEKRSSIAPVEGAVTAPQEARHEGMEEDPLLRMLQRIVQTQKRMIDSHERRIQQLREEVDAEKRASVDL